MAGPQPTTMPRISNTINRKARGNCPWLFFVAHISMTRGPQDAGRKSLDNIPRAEGRRTQGAGHTIEPPMVNGARFYILDPRILDF